MGADRVEYRVPDWDNGEGNLRADMHFHTHFSDSFTTVKQATDLARRRNVGLAITDHNLIGGSLEAFSDNKDLFLIPGIEISSWDGPHILVYFYSVGEMKEYWERNVKPYIPKSRWLAIDKGTEWILDSLEDVNCVVSAAHPLGYFFSVKGVQKAIDHGILTEDVAKRFDAFEVTCGGMFRNENIRARECSEKYGIGMTAGTDGHVLYDLGSVLSVSDATDLDGFLDDVKKGRNRIVGKEKMMHSKVLTGLACTTRFATTCLPSSLHRKYELIRYGGKNKGDGLEKG